MYFKVKKNKGSIFNKYFRVCEVFNYYTNVNYGLSTCRAFQISRLFKKMLSPVSRRHAVDYNPSEFFHLPKTFVLCLK